MMVNEEFKYLCRSIYIQILKYIYTDTYIYIVYICMILYIYIYINELYFQNTENYLELKKKPLKLFL